MNSTVQKMNSLVPVNIQSTLPRMNTLNPMNSTKANSSGFLGLSLSFILFIVFLLISAGVFIVYYNTIMNTFQQWMTGSTIQKESETIQTAEPVSPQDEDTKHTAGTRSIVEKMLPPAKEVFTVSKNDYSFYDAAPLCKALGAELATYDEVKEAWNKGADWCNYGWVKGQMAVYPTQNSTYEELQQGPAEQRGACGKPGLNGGYFDNPELKFGVTCVGKRPAQSQHDATKITSGATRPLTASGLEFEKRVQHFQEGSESMGILPFNKEKWGS